MARFNSWLILLTGSWLIGWVIWESFKKGESNEMDL